MIFCVAYYKIRNTIYLESVIPLCDLNCGLNITTIAYYYYFISITYKIVQNKLQEY